MQEHLDYELVQSTNPEFNKAVVRVNIFRDHRQTIQVKKCMLMSRVSNQSLENFAVFCFSLCNPKLQLASIIGL